ncbi:cell division protein FtsZ, partial [Halobacteriales archaeon QH_8_68_33]
MDSIIDDAIDEAEDGSVPSAPTTDETGGSGTEDVSTSGEMTDEELADVV